MTITPPVIVLGGGGHASVVLEVLTMMGATVLGHVAPAGKECRTLSTTSLGEDDAVFAWKANAILLVNGVGSSGAPTLRASLFRRFRENGYCFQTIQHPSAIVSMRAELRQGCQIMAGAVIQAGCRLKENVLVNTAAVVDHDVCVGPHSHIASGAVVAGGVVIGEGCHIGAGATIIQGMTIGPGAVVGAGAVVVSLVPPGAVVMGVPARPLPVNR